MDKIVVWGTEKRTAMYYKWLEGQYDIVAFVATRECDALIHGIPVISPASICDYPCDRLVMTVEAKDADEHIKIALSKGVNERSIVTIDELVVEGGNGNEYVKYVSSIQLQIVKEILYASDEEVENYDWMYNRVIRYGIFCFNAHWYEIEDNDFHYAVYGLQQIPEEFAEFCNFIAKFNISTAAEIGVYRGRSAFFLCAILARKNKNLTYKLIDIFDRIDDFNAFKEVLPQLEKCIPSCSDNYKNQKYDFVFIDADHSYDASISDYNNVGQFSKVIVAFHDVYAHEYDKENGGTVRTWEEVVQRNTQYEHRVFSMYPQKWMGIGCIVKQ